MKIKPTTYSCTTWVEVAKKIEQWLPKYNTVTDEELAALIKPLFSDLYTMAALADITRVMLEREWRESQGRLLDEVV